MKYIKSFKKTLNENIQWDDWGQPTKKYRIAGSDSDYTERDIVDINDIAYSKLKEMLEKNNLKYTIEEILTYDANKYALDRTIIDGKICKKENKYSYYLEAVLKDIKNNYGATIYKSSFNVCEYNDGNFGITTNNNNHTRSYVCFGWDGLMEFFREKFTF